jgi:serine/threonine-protein kinase
MKDIPRYDSFEKIQPIDKGLSNDKKYYIETAEYQRLLLRVADISEYERKETIFNMMKCATVLDIPMPRPVDFGVCNDGKNVYQLLTWCDGENLETVLPTLSKTKQYELGLKAGEILRKIHSIPAPDNLEDWSIRYMEVNDDRVKAFSNCGVQIGGSDAILRYYEDNKHLLNNRPQCLHHGDYHIGNFLITDNYDLSVIDWELLDYGNFADPWEEFNRIGLSKVIPHFTTGLIRGYFDGEPSAEFWRLLAFYLSAGALMLVAWAFYSQQDELEYSIQNADNVLCWFDNMNNPVPTWYLKDFHVSCN